MIEHTQTDMTEMALQDLFASEPTKLTFIAEAAGEISKDYAVLICSVAICHEKSYVREGALYGLAPHIEDPDVKAMVTYVADHDESQVVREIARDILIPWRDQ